MDNSNGINIVNALVDELRSLSNSKNCLKFDSVTFPIFKLESSNLNITKGLPEESNVSRNFSLDLILSDIPLDIAKDKSIDGIYLSNLEVKISRYWGNGLNALNFIKKDGLALFIIEPTVLSTRKGIKDISNLNSKGFFINAIFNAPQGILLPLTKITPIIVVITRKFVESIFVAELLNESQARTVANRYLSSSYSDDLKSGIALHRNHFHSFPRIKIKQQIEKLETQYKEYEEFTLGELAIEINFVNKEGILLEKSNSIYIPRIGNNQVMCDISNQKIKHSHYFQVALNNQVINEYLSSFFKSNLGRLVLNSLTSNTYIPHLNKSDLESAPIALPKLEEQTKILSTQKKLSKLKDAINNLDSELALNPNNSNSILSQLDRMVIAINNVADKDKVLGMLRQGESKTLEFKESLSLDLNKTKHDKNYTPKKEDDIETSSLKTIVGFINTNGGTLLVGIKDDGAITGINDELKRFHHNNKDKFFLYFKNLTSKKVGADFYDYFDSKIISVNNKELLMVECKPSPSPCFLNDEDFYVRTNPATDKLIGKQQHEYIIRHFEQ